eukprot:PLAT3542.7.p1 GENE.PLAT3542.7~~PLAT3542.7.p1  ORF type:complete len:265 (-),score=104.83 PLAT3542.7:421-1215(-)
MDVEETELLYHEKQEALLCGQHCLNNLLQGPFFSAPDLAAIARELDEREAELLGGVALHERVSDDGNFGIEVLREALLRSHGLRLGPLTPEILADAGGQQAFVCNLHSHWYALRRTEGDHWWDLNSLLPEPEPITSFFLSALLAQLQGEGWNIQIVEGKLPAPVRDPSLGKPSSWSVVPYAPRARARSRSRSHSPVMDEEDALRAAMEQSKREAELDTVLALSREEEDMRRAMELSRAEDAVLDEAGLIDDDLAAALALSREEM